MPNPKHRHRYSNERDHCKPACALSQSSRRISKPSGDCTSASINLREQTCTPIMQLYFQLCLQPRTPPKRIADMSNQRSIQIRVRTATHRKLKGIAYESDMTIAEFILQALADQDHPELTKLIRAEIKHRPKPGAPHSRRVYLKLFLKRLPPRFRSA